MTGSREATELAAIAMQYPIDLPADYDMAIIRARVRDRHGATDGLPGLAAKAYLIRERGRYGARGNQYAPFYLWNDPRAQAAFLLGDGFSGLCSSFGRPVVQCWIAQAVDRGPASEREPASAVRTVAPIGQDADLSAYATEELNWLRQRTAQCDLVLAAVGFDAYRWQRMRFALSVRPPEDLEAESGERYEVLHLSRPGMPPARKAA